MIRIKTYHIDLAINEEFFFPCSKKKLKTLRNTIGLIRYYDVRFKAYSDVEDALNKMIEDAEDLGSKVLKKRLQKNLDDWYGLTLL